MLKEGEHNIIYGYEILSSNGRKLYFRFKSSDDETNMGIDNNDDGKLKSHDLESKEDSVKKMILMVC